MSRGVSQTRGRDRKLLVAEAKKLDVTTSQIKLIECPTSENASQAAASLWI